MRRRVYYILLVMAVVLLGLQLSWRTMPSSTYTKHHDAFGRASTYTKHHDAFVREKKREESAIRGHEQPTETVEFKGDKVVYGTQEKTSTVHDKTIRENHVSLAPAATARQFITHPDDVPTAHVKSVNCHLIARNNTNEIFKAKTYQKTYKPRIIQDTEFIKKTANCSDFIQKRKYLTKPVSAEEEEFPIAFSILMYKHAEQTERLLRAIYRPQNTYCIHVDYTADLEVRAAMLGIASCFDNVFVATQSVDVQWGTYKVLEPDLVCLEELWKYKRWKYFINLTGQEFPLRTNLELVKILKVYNGANDINSDGPVTRIFNQRISHVHKGLHRTKTKKQPAPHSIVPIKGSVHIAAVRGFIDFLLHNQVSLDFRSWITDTGHASEHFFNTFNHNPQFKAPGSYTGEPELRFSPSTHAVRFKNWNNFRCQGKIVRQICILGVGDVALMQTRHEMFANKFFLEYQPLGLRCLEELLFDKVRAEVTAGGVINFNTTIYEELPFVNNHQ